MGEDSTWEDYDEMARKYSEFILGDKEIVEGRGVSAEEQLKLVAIGSIDKFESEEPELMEVGYWNGLKE
jgi:hypothetical protein